MIELTWDVGDEARGAVAVITLQRPERRNALDTQACTDLAGAVTTAVAERARVILLQGSGGYFCAGADLATVEDDGFQPALRGALLALALASCPVLAAVEGPCLGGGVQLAVASDLRVATADARFGVPAAKLGLAVDLWTVERAARLMGGSLAAQVLLAADEVSGQRAYDTGFVHRVGTPADALDWARSIAALAPMTLQVHKAGLGGSDPAAFDALRARAWASADLAEGKTAFREKRRPVFRGE